MPDSPYLPEDCQRLMRELSCVVIIPTYNNAATLLSLIEKTLLYASDIILINDGSTDETPQILESFHSRLILINYSQNRGKGYALRQGFAKALQLGARYAITLDADGQHDPSQIPLFLAALQSHPDSLLIGTRSMDHPHMPKSNRLANRFSNFWFFVETTQKLPDTQSGFRLYPLEKINSLPLKGNRYEFELEVLVRAAWKQIPIHPINIEVHYPLFQERVSHFHPVKDFLRIFLLNTKLVLLSLFIFYPQKIIKMLTWTNIKNFIHNNITHSPENNLSLSASLGLGFFWGVSPFWGYHMILSAVSAHFLKLNKVIAIVGSNISIPPMIPPVIYASFWMGSHLLNQPIAISLESLHTTNPLRLIYQSLIQYVVGSLSLGVIGGFFVFLFFWLLLSIFRKNPIKNKESSIKQKSSFPQ